MDGVWKSACGVIDENSSRHELSISMSYDSSTFVL
jgi:hypothetical protein